MGVFAIAMYTSLWCIVVGCKASGSKNFQQLVKRFLGIRAERGMEVIIAIYCYFCVVGSLILVGDVAVPLLQHLAGDDKGAWYTKRPIPICGAAILSMPCSLSKTFQRCVLAA